MNCWIGKPEAVEEALAKAGADEDANGQYIIEGPKGEHVLAQTDDLLIWPGTFFFVNGKKNDLCMLLMIMAPPKITTRVGA